MLTDPLDNSALTSAHVVPSYTSEGANAYHGLFIHGSVHATFL